MTKRKLGVIGGTSKFDSLTNQLSEEHYATLKAYCWLELLKDGRIPTKWLKATKTGTSVNWRTPDSESDFEEAQDHLEAYVKRLNTEYDVGLEYDRKSSKDKEDSNQ